MIAEGIEFLEEFPLGSGALLGQVPVGRRICRGQGLCPVGLEFDRMDAGMGGFVYHELCGFHGGYGALAGYVVVVNADLGDKGEFPLQ